MHQKYPLVQLVKTAPDVIITTRRIKNITKMPKIKNAQEAEKIVYSCYRFPDPRPFNLKTSRQDHTWTVIFNLQAVRDVEEHEWHIDETTGDINKIR